MLNYVLKKIVGTKNERELRRLTPLVARVGELEPKMKAMKDEEFPRLTASWKEQVRDKGRPLEELMPEVFAAAREASVRSLGMRHFDVQVLGGAVLHQGKIAEMKTGEGKTLVATLPCALNALAGRGVHVVTVNDYLARRDAEWMGRLYKFLGLSVGVIVHGLTDQERQDNYGRDITYGQNNEFGFDYLRDNMKFRLQDYVQRELQYAIVDEVDSILIDEARTPLIISGPTDDATDKYYVVNQVIPSMIRDQDFTVDEKTKTVVMTDSGIGKMEKKLGVGNLYDPDQIETLHHVEQALRAHHLYRNEVDYVVKEGEVVIVDEFTGRIMPGRRWSDGLHQAIEAKEGVKIENENQTLATISFQNYFRMYSKLAGMTGTADTEAAEFADIYKLDVVVIPTNRQNIRKDSEDLVYKTEREKFNALCGEIEERHGKGQPILVGTVSVAKSEVVSSLLKKRGVPHNVLNAKHHQREAEIVAQAGRKGAVTISTNMAGRGTDIVLGGNPEMMAKHEVGPAPEELAEGESIEDLDRRRAEWSAQLLAATGKLRAQTAKEHEEVVATGGLHIVGTERHESRRIDNQLRGRAARQGDPGSSRFYLSLDDDLMKRFASDRVAGLMQRLKMPEGEPIEHPIVNRSIAKAQTRVESRNFDIRKQLLEYDDVANDQRRVIYQQRNEILTGSLSRDYVMALAEDVSEDYVDRHCPAGKDPSEWGWDAFENLVNDTYGFKPSEKGLGAGDTNTELKDKLRTAVRETYEAKEKAVGEQTLRDFEKFFMLQTVDTLWKDHLLALDHLKEGIGLRGYGQRDPLVEYKKESFQLFEAMKEGIEEQILQYLFRFEVAQAPAERPPRDERAPAPGAPEDGSTPSAAAATGSASSRRAAAELEKRRQKEQNLQLQGSFDPTAGGDFDVSTVKASGPKVGRNDPCPCGSGKKYKKCHGATGAGAAAS